MMVKGGADQVPPFIALTGGIGAGKSTALAALERLGAAVLSTDAVVHELYESAQVRDAVVAHFGPQVAPDGVVDRGRLATVAFRTPQDRAWLEAFIWPLVRERCALQLRRHRRFHWRTHQQVAARGGHPKLLPQRPDLAQRELTWC